MFGCTHSCVWGGMWMWKLTTLVAKALGGRWVRCRFGVPVCCGCAAACFASARRVSADVLSLDTQIYIG
jgi:hypothetical protein